MKTKIFILAAMLAAAVGAQAQYSDYYYHRTGDTIYDQSEIGFYKWWDFDHMVNLGERIGVRNMQCTPGWGNSLSAMITNYFTPTPLKIVGIAGCPLYSSTSWGGALPEYLYLFDAGPMGPVYKDRVQIYFPDSTLPMRYLNVKNNAGQNDPGEGDSCCGNHLTRITVNLCERYFDSAIAVSDSFYIGWSRNNLAHSTGLFDYLVACLGNTFTNYHEPCSELDSFSSGIPFSNCYFPVIDYWICNDTMINRVPNSNYTWEYWSYSPDCRQFVLVYPLIQIDTTVPPSFLCDPVQNFSATVLDSGSGCVFFTWDDFYHYTFCEVQYYTFEQGYNSAVTTTVTGNNLLHLCDLDTTLTYFARIRAYCDTSKIETEWSNWVSFTFPHSAPPQGVAEPSLLDRFTHVMPNPAADRVTVSSELGLRRIEVYNARGILVYSEPSHYSSKTIDLRGWPSGQYMMTIETRQGKTAKRLVVTR